MGEASDGLEAVKAAGRLRPDVVLMDIYAYESGVVEVGAVPGRPALD